MFCCFCKRLACAVTVMLLIFSGIPFAGAGSVGLDVENDPQYGPVDGGYIYTDGNPDPVGYEDPTISVSLIRGRYKDTNWLAARIALSSPAQFRTALAARYGSSHTVLGSTIAKNNKAVLAINGDFFSARSSVGSVIRAGKVYRDNCKGNMDILVVDLAGDMHLLRQATEEDMAPWMDNVMHSFTFGPALIVDGIPSEREQLHDHNIGIDRSAQRMAICQTGPLEYLCICSEGPEDPGSKGLNLWDFETLIVTEFPDVLQAYNLDGGSSTTMIFRRGDTNWAKINAPQNRKKRLLGDIIYFASAYSGEYTVDDSEE